MSLGPPGDNEENNDSCKITQNTKILFIHSTFFVFAFVFLFLDFLKNGLIRQIGRNWT